MLQRQIIATIVIVLALIGGACSDGDESTSSTSIPTNAGSAEEVVFGSGVVPETLPDSFPMPAGSSVGSTMVVTDTGFTEVIIRVNAELGITTQFFEQNLELAGFEVDGSAADTGSWLIEFNLDGVKGTIDISEPQEAISQAVVRYNVP